ncbi:MAG: hypothetical protein IJL88_03890 [Clostridia bacterium]|nr:hypothetical protein [Clostridia bacterium]
MGESLSAVLFPFRYIRDAGPENRFFDEKKQKLKASGTIFHRGTTRIAALRPLFSAPTSALP